MFSAANCTQIPRDTATDPGVAGTGVLLSFIITAALALSLSAYIILTTLTPRARTIHTAKIMRKLLLSFSDQQILTGIGIQAVGLAKIQSMVSYHFFLIWMLSVLSTATHQASLLALVDDFKRDWVLRWLRQFLMFVNWVLSIAYGVIVLMFTLKSLDDTLPVQCALVIEGKGTPGNAGLSIAGTIAVIAGNAIVFVGATWFLHTRREKGRRVIQGVGMLILIGCFVGATTRVVSLSQAFGDPGVALRDQNEREWSYGQLLSMLLLLLPLLSVIEILRGEMRVPDPVVEVDVRDDQTIPLTSQMK